MSPNENSNEIETAPSTVLNVPQWINSDYIKDILILDEKTNWKYISHEVKMANDKGENYASVLYRMKVVAQNNDNQIEDLSYILKVNPVLEGQLKELMEVYNVFGKEVEMYKLVVPNFHKLLEQVGDSIPFSPKCLKTTTPEAEQIILEDLSKRGFKVASRHDGLDMDHIKLVIERLCKFHAVSAVFQENNGPYSSAFMKGMYNEKLKPMMEQFFNINLAVLKDSIKCMKEGQRYLKQMENYEEKSFDKCIDAVKFNPQGFNVLNHGDLWTNNLMFQYDENDKVKDLLFIDLQMPVWGSPAIDLHYFIISSAEKRIKIDEYDTIVEFYHENLIKWLEMLGYKGHFPTLFELHVDLLQRSFLGVMAAIAILPITLLKDCEDADINNMINESEVGMNFKKKLYTNPVYTEIMEILLAYFSKKGILIIE